MMNKCHDKAGCKVKPPNQYANNPWDVTENFEQVNYRRAMQYDFLLEQLKKNKEKGSPLSAIFLQEINELVFNIKDYPDPMTNKVKTLLLVEELTEKDIEILLAFKFLESLKELGYTAYATTPEMNCKPMVTIVNTEQLKVSKDEPYGALPVTANGNEKNTAFVIKVYNRTKDDEEPINLVNLHLDYGTDYVESILDFQTQMVNQNIMGIMAGDTNHPPNSGLIGGIGDWYHTSNIDTDESSGELTDRDLRSSRLKNYDLLFANPSVVNSSVTTQELDGWYFTVKDGTATINPIDENTNRKYVSQPGLPWMKEEIFKALLKNGFIEKTTYAYGVECSFTEKSETEKQQMLALIRKMNGPNLQIFDLTYENLKELLVNVNSVGHNKYKYAEVKEEVKVGSDDGSFKGNVVWQKPTKDASKSEEITIARVFHANDNVKLEFPALKNTDEKQAHLDWIAMFLQEFSKQNKDIKHVQEIPVIVANGFEPEILKALLEQIHKINSTPEAADHILLKFECTDHSKKYKDLQHIINLHNKKIDSMVSPASRNRYSR